MLSLREIEIYGFKSFAERTRLPLPGHVVAVVGPNGSGKSNVADAVLWALGEQSAKSLRGQKMQDVIFQGSHRRQPAGSAEVYLLFEEDGGGKVRVGRRLMRTGESSYLMDGRAVRLKDIHDYLQRNGVSTQGTFLVEQGRVEGMLAASPEERRMILEEVAGIAHYKENRRSALLKLESTQSNLTRLQDIMAEVASQMAVLKKQAAKADRLVRLTDELRQRKRSFLGRSFRLVAGRRAALARDLDLLKQEVIRREALLAKADSELEEARGRLAAHETAMGDLTKEIHRRELDLERLNGENKRRTELILAGQGRLRAIAADRSDLERRVAGSEKECEGLSRELESLQAQEREAEAREETARGTLAGARKAVEEAAKGIEEARAEVFRIAQEVAGAGANLGRLAEDIARQEERLKRLQRDEEGLAAREAEAQESLEDRRAKHGHARTLREQAEGALGTAEADLEAARRSLDAARAASAAAEKEQASCAARLKALEDQGASLRSSADAYLEREAPERLTASLASSVAGADPRLLPALAAAYGPLLDAHTAAGWEGLPDLLRHLAEGREGVALFALDGAQGSPDSGPGKGAEKAPGFRGWLPEAAGLPEATSRHLPRVALLDGPEQARRFAGEFGHPAVSLDGVWVDPHGLVRGGSGGTGGAALLEHEGEMRRCAEAVREAAEAVTAAGARAEEERAALDRATARRAEAAEAAEGARRAEVSAAQELRDAEQVAGRLATSRDLLSGEKAQASSDLEAMRSDRAGYESRTEELRASQGEAQGRLDGLVRALDEARKVQEAAHEGLTEASSGRAEAIQRLRSKGAEAERAVALGSELRATLGRLLREAEEIEGRNGTLAGQVTACDRELQELLLALEADRGRRATFEDDLRSLQAAVQEREQADRQVRDALGEVRADAAAGEAESHAVEVEHRHLLERIAELGGETPEGLSEAFADEPPIADEEREALQKGLLRLEGRIQEIGAVNMLAREEFKEMEARQAFLAEQKRDLDEAIASLQETIRKINRTTRERFMEAFHAVQEHFAHLFKEVFDGGEARLNLMDEANPLESGVEIFAQPPGKKLTVLNLLSGGEKAKVALALLFALFKYRPHPFFILDEADAPLDEANINRFNRLLAQFRGQTQFLVVSHNKRTMELADVLYGVTMVEGGVSRVVSVRFEGGGEEGSGAVGS